MLLHKEWRKYKYTGLIFQKEILEGKTPKLIKIVSYREKKRHYFANKGLSSLSYGFSSSHVWM